MKILSKLDLFKANLHTMIHDLTSKGVEADLTEEEARLLLSKKCVEIDKAHYKLTDKGTKWFTKAIEEYAKKYALHKKG